MRSSHSDYRHRYAFYVDWLAEDIRVSIEAARPIAVTNDGDLRVLCLVRGRKSVPCGHGNSEGGKEISAHLVGAHIFRRISESYRRFVFREGYIADDIGEDGLVCTQMVVDI